MPSSVAERTLVLHPGAIGDVLLAIPALRALPHPIEIAAQSHIGALLVALGAAARARAFDSLGVDALFTDEPLDGAPVARHIRAAGRVVCWFGARDARFVDRMRALSPDAVVALPASPPHLVWRHLLDTVGGAADTTPIVVTPELVERGRASLRAIGWDGRSRVLVVHPGAGGVAKRWPADGFADVIRDVDATVVVNDGPADSDAVDALIARSSRPLLRLTRPELPALAGVLALASYLGNDSGVSHLAATVGAPSVVLFTEAARPWAPWSPAARCLTVTTSRIDDGERRIVAAALSDLR